MRITARATVSLPPLARAPSAGPGPGQHDVVFLTAATGLLVESPGIESPGFTIQRTADGGRHWRTVWRRRGLVPYSISAYGSLVVADGALTTDGGARLTPVLVRSDDGGRTWTVIRPRFPRAANHYLFDLRLRLVSPSLAFMVLNNDYYNPPLPGPSFGPLLRSTDGGLEWSAVRLPGRDSYDTGGLAFVGTERGFVTGSHPGICRGRIWGTTDAGATWRPVPGTCVGYGLDSLSFPDGGVGYAAAEPTNRFPSTVRNQPPAAPLALLTTRDGGAHWSRRLAGSGPAGTPPPVGGFAEIDFPQVSNGYALVGGCPQGANGLCGGELWVSSDAGRSWRDTGHQGTDLDLAGPRDLWLVDAPDVVPVPPVPEAEVGDILWNSTDGGRLWRALARPSVLAPSPLLASGSLLFAHTAAGDFESSDGATRWHSAHDPALESIEDRPQTGLIPAVVQSTGAVVAAAPTSAGVSPSLWLSADGGRTGALLRPAGLDKLELSSIAFATAQRGLAVASTPSEGIPSPLCLTAPSVFRLARPKTLILATGNSGRTWKSLTDVPFALTNVAYAGETVLATGTGCQSSPPSGRLPLPAELVTISTNGGRSFTAWSLPGLALGCSPAVAGGVVAVLCPPIGPSSADLLVSEDSGRTWHEYQFSSDTENLALTAGAGRLWLYGAPGALWSSGDGGASWTSAAPAFPVP
jgi:photosystem II stability/assembly factor-like uncharacterized protein